MWLVIYLFTEWINELMVYQAHRYTLLLYVCDVSLGAPATIFRNIVRISQPQKEGTLTICDSMDGPGEYNAKWNKAVIEKQILYDLTYVEPNEQN